MSPEVTKKIRFLNGLKDHVYFKKDLVIGHGIEAVTYAFLNQYPIISISAQEPFFLDKIEEQELLDMLNLPFLEDSTYYYLWHKLLFYLGLSGKRLMPDKVEKIQIEENMVKVSSKTSRKYLFQCEKIHIFDTEGVSGLPMPYDVVDKVYRILDLFKMTGGKNRYDGYALEREEDFGKKIKCFNYHMIKKGTGFVVESFFSESKMMEFENSPTMINFFLEEQIQKRRPTILEFQYRKKYLEEDHTYKNTEILKFYNNDNISDVLDKQKKAINNGYISRIRYFLKQCLYQEKNSMTQSEKKES